MDEHPLGSAQNGIILRPKDPSQWAGASKETVGESFFFQVGYVCFFVMRGRAHMVRRSMQGSDRPWTTTHTVTYADHMQVRFAADARHVLEFFWNEFRLTQGQEPMPGMCVRGRVHTLCHDTT